MSNTHDYDIANAVGATFRADLNNCLADIQSTNSGSSPPTTLVVGSFAPLFVACISLKQTFKSCLNVWPTAFPIS